MLRLVTTILILSCILSLKAGAAEPVEIFRIRVENSTGGRVQVSLDKGKTYTAVGKVRRHATSTHLGFPAAAYLPDSSVAATAIHGLRLNVHANKWGKPQIISIVPAEFAVIPKGYGGHIPYKSGIYTDIPAGKAIFRSLAPFAGNPVKLERKGKLIDLPASWKPKKRDVIVILVELPQPCLRKLEFENKAGGKVTAEYADGKIEQVATVSRPLKGIGRFDGTSYTGVGLINTNHGGVLTISTAPISNSKLFEGQGTERRGGFEIQPYEHALTQPPMPQAMVIAPVDEKPLEGQPPIFRGFIGLAYDPHNPEQSIRAEVSTDGKNWSPMPKCVGKVDDAVVLRSVSNIRLLFPAYGPDFLARMLKSAANQFQQRATSKK